MNKPWNETQKLLEEAREALKNKDVRLARRLAERVATLNPDNEEAWLILGALANPKESVALIQRALEINPQNIRAQKGMEWAKQRLEEQMTAPAAPAENLEHTQPGQGAAAEPVIPLDIEIQQLQGGVAEATPPEAAPTTEPTATPEAAIPAAAPARKKRKTGAGMVLVLIGVLLLALAAWFAIHFPNQIPAVSELLATPQALLKDLGWMKLPAFGVNGSVRATASPTLITRLATPTQGVRILASTATAVPASPTPFAPKTSTVPASETSTMTVPPTGTATSASQGSSPTPSVTESPTNTAVESATPESGNAAGGVVSAVVVEDTPIPQGTTSEIQAGANGERWIEVDLSDQALYAYEGDTLINSFSVSTGAWETPTVTGIYKIYIKLRASAMRGEGYYLPDVPYVMFFYKDYGIHGTYWHDSFGTPVSHGCVNMTISDAEWLYQFVQVGTVVNVHE